MNAASSSHVDTDLFVIGGGSAAFAPRASPPRMARG